MREIRGAKKEPGSCLHAITPSAVGLYILYCLKFKLEGLGVGNSLVAQWLGLRTSTAEGLGSIPGLGTKIPQATCPLLPLKKKFKSLKK